MNPKGKKPSPRTGATRKRKRDARPQTRQSISPSQSPSKRGRDAQSELSPIKRVEDVAGMTSQATGESSAPEQTDLPEAPITLLSKADLVTKVEDLKKICTTDARESQKLGHSKSSGTKSSEEVSKSAAIFSRPGAIHIVHDTIKTEQVTAKKEARPAHGLVLHIPAASPSRGIHIDDTEELVATPSPRSKGSPSPSKDSGFRTPSRSPSKLIFGVGFGSSSGILSELPFYMDSPGKRYDEKLAQALASSPALGSMGPPDSSPGLGSRSSNAFGTPESPTGDRFGSPSAALGTLRRSRSQLLDSPSARAITNAIDQRDSERDGTSWLRAGNHGRPPRAALGTLYEKPAAHFLGAGSVFGRSLKPLASPERKSITETSDGKVDPTAPVSIEEFLMAYEKVGASPGNVGTTGVSQNLYSRAASESDFYAQPGDGSPKLRTHRLVPLARPDTSSQQTSSQESDEGDSELELSDKENM